MYQIAIPILAFFLVVGTGGAILGAQASLRRRLRSRIHGSAVDAMQESAHLGGNLVGTLEQVGRAVSTEQAPSDLREKLIQAGYHDVNAPTVYVGAQLLLVVLGILLGALVFLSLRQPLMLRVCLGFGIVCVLALLPNLLVSLQQRRRRTEIRGRLPDAVDLLEVCVSAGMGLDMAWNSVSDEMRGVSPALADEMALANLEMHLGVSRAEALRHMSQRTGVDELSSLVATLVQSERFGTSISQALSVYADSLRAERSQRAEEAAEKLMVKLLLPMLVFIFPVLFIVILGPAAIKIMETFKIG